jgi:ATP-binding cassette, subfamily B, bacterial IrtB/YbtQ
MFKTLLRIIDWCGDFKKQLYTGFIFTVLTAWTTAMPVFIAAWTLGLIVEDAQGGTPFDPAWIGYSFGLIALCVFFRFLFDYLRAKKQEVISYELVAKNRLEIGSILKRVSLGYLDSHSTGEILSAVTTGLSVLEKMGIRMIDTFVAGYVNAAILIIFLAFFSPLAALTALAGILLSAVFLKRISKKSRKNTSVLAKANEDLAGAAVEYARGLPIVKSFGQEGASIASMKNACADSREINCKTELGFTPDNCMHLFVLRAASVGIVLIAAFLCLTGQMPFAFMLAFIMFSFIIFTGVEPVSDSAHVMSIIANALDKLDGIRESGIIDEDGRDIRLTNYDIEFKNVDFGYDGRKVLDNVSLEIPENTACAIVGPSGSGKTTLCSLIARFYDVDAGSISTGGHDVREFTCDSLLENISMVFQNVYLFNDTVKNNIRFGKPDASDEDVRAAAKSACCHDFIMSLPDGYDTVVGEGGSGLSGGEKQRVSIARAILKDAPVIILDEATASVDPENEYEIQKAISALTKDKTVITIAHRLATIEHADRIFVLNEGRIVQQGTHTELVREDGIYKRFIDIRRKAEGWSIEKA